MGTSGGFGKEGGPKQCTAVSKRSKERCQGPAVLTSANQRCRMHGGHGAHLAGTANPNFKHGRHSRYLPSNLADLYETALANPELLEMSDHIALLEGHIQQTLQASSGGDPVPKWEGVAAMFAELETAVLSGDHARVCLHLEDMHKLLDAGIKWDSTWVQVTDTMEQLRKMTDTEVKRRKELHQMVPVERVMILVAAVGQAVKRNVTNPDEVDAVHRELAMLVASDRVPSKPSVERIGPEVIDVAPWPNRGKTRKAVKREQQLAQVQEA